MSECESFSELDDPAFLAARTRVREELECVSESKLKTELMTRYQAMNAEFRWRARLAWEGT
jgi:hypothetical protein